MCTFFISKTREDPHFVCTDEYVLGIFFSIPRLKLILQSTENMPKTANFGPKLRKLPILLRINLFGLIPLVRVFYSISPRYPELFRGSPTLCCTSGAFRMSPISPDLVRDLRGAQALGPSPRAFAAQSLAMHSHRTKILVRSELAIHCLVYVPKGLFPPHEMRLRYVRYSPKSRKCANSTIVC